MKLSKLPDRTPVKIGLSVSPELSRRLRNFANYYKQTYGEDEDVADLIPFMLDQFLDADRKFGKAEKKSNVLELPVVAAPVKAAAR